MLKYPVRRKSGFASAICTSTLISSHTGLHVHHLRSTGSLRNVATIALPGRGPPLAAANSCQQSKCVDVVRYACEASANQQQDCICDGLILLPNILPLLPKGPEVASLISPILGYPSDDEPGFLSSGKVPTDTLRFHSRWHLFDVPGGSDSSFLLWFSAGGRSLTGPF